MNKKLIFELKRKLMHLLVFLYIIVYTVTKRFFGHDVALLALGGVLIFYLVVEYFRVQLKLHIPLFNSFWRDEEKNRVGGEVFAVLGAIIAFALFDFQIALCALLMTIFGDMASALFGITLGKHWSKILPDKAWEGIIAEFIVDLIVGVIVLENILIALIMAFVATFVETYFRHIDDNLTIPVFAGFIGEIFLRII